MKGVFACPLAGCGAVATPGAGWFFGSTSAVSTASLVRVATDGKNALVASTIQTVALRKCAVGGCAPSGPTPLAVGLAKFFALDDTSVYFVAAGDIVKVAK